MPNKINTVTGTCTPQELGTTLVHEHLLIANWQPTHLIKNLIPQMRQAGVSDDKIQAMLVDNPRRWFAGE